MGDWHGFGVRPNVARRRAAVAAVLLATSLCVSCAGSSGATANPDGASTRDVHAEVPSTGASSTAITRPTPAPAAADAAAPAAASIGVGLIPCPAAFVTWATTQSGLDVDAEQPATYPFVPEGWRIDDLGAPSCAFSGVRDGADPLTGQPRRISTIVLAYLAESGSVLEAAYADTRTALEDSALSFASESSDAGLHAAQYFHDDEGGVVDATLTVTMRLDPPFAVDAGLATGVGLLIVRGTHRVALPVE